MCETPLLIFAKAPLAGKVKTRLMPNCSAEQAAEIATILLRACLQVATSAWPGKVILSTWPDTRNETMQGLAKQFSVELSVQDCGDLGMKMASAFGNYGYPAAIMGSDAPLIDPASLNKAHSSLQAGENVIGPSCDGGYYFIGLSKPQPQIFSDMPWSTDQVLAVTLARQPRDNEFTLLQETYDIDSWSDVQRARTQLPELDVYLSQQFSAGRP